MPLAPAAHSFPATAQIPQFALYGELTRATDAEGELDTVVQRAFLAHALADAGLVQDVHAALLQHAGADRRFDLGAAARFEHD